MPSKRHSKGPRGAKAKPGGDADALTLDNGGQSWKRDRISGELSCVRYRLLSVLRLLLRKKMNTEGWQKSFEEHYRRVDVKTRKTEQLEYFCTPWFPVEYSLGLATMSAAWDRRIAVLAHRPAWYIKDIVSVIVAGPDVVTRLQRLHFDAPGPPFVSGEDGRLDFTYQFRTAAEAFLNEEVQAAVDAGDLRIPSRPADAAMWVQDRGFILPKRILDLFVGKRRIGTKKSEEAGEAGATDAKEIILTESAPGTKAPGKPTRKSKPSTAGKDKKRRGRPEKSSNRNKKAWKAWLANKGSYRSKREFYVKPPGDYDKLVGSFESEKKFLNALEAGRKQVDRGGT